jgi:NAD(P)-dependent dehydrogenase (short-subunit alcohol dehydrogenase family)
MMRFKDKVALVTGSSRNIGKSVAEGLAREGAAVVLNASVSSDELDAATGEFRAKGYRVISAQCDVGSRAAVAAMVDRVVAELGGIDILVMSHSVRPTSPFLEISEEQWNGVMDVNLNSSFHLCQLVIPRMLERGGGSIVALSGDFARLNGQRAHVFAGLAARSVMLRTVMQEFAEDRIRVNFVHPGVTETYRKHPEWYPETTGEPHANPQLLATIPAGRAGTVEEVAAAVLWLASDEASYVTGATISVTGGWGV